LFSLYLRTELQNTLPFSFRAASNCPLTFTHHLQDLAEQYAFSQRRWQQTFSTATRQVQYLLVIKSVTCGNTPSHFPYFLPSSGRKNRLRKLGKCDVPRLHWNKGRNRCSLSLSPLFHKLSAAVLPIVYVHMNRMSELSTSHFRLCVTYRHLGLPRCYFFLWLYISTSFNKKKTLFTSTLFLKLRKKLVKCYVWSIAL